MMFRTFLTATAITGFMMSGAMAQSQDQNQQPQEENTELDLQAVDTGMAAANAAGGQQITVQSGDTIVLQPSQDGTFTLNFQFGQTGTPAVTSTMGGAAGATPAQTAVERDQLQQADPEQLSVENLMDSTVYGANDEDIGNVGDVLLTEEGEVDALIVDVGGFLGIGTRQVAIGVDNLQFMVDQGDTWHVFTPFTREQLENQPEYDPDTYQDDVQNQRLTAQEQ